MNNHESPPMPLGKWQLQGTVLSPTNERMNEYIDEIAKLADETDGNPLRNLRFCKVPDTNKTRLSQSVEKAREKLMTLRLGNGTGVGNEGSQGAGAENRGIAGRNPHITSPVSEVEDSQTLAIHTSHLEAAGGPLRSLISLPFQESITDPIELQESYEAFAIIRKFLYCQKIDLSAAPSDMVWVADRWELHPLFEGCIAYEEQTCGDIISLLQRWIPAMPVIPISWQFKSYISLKFALQVEDILHYGDERLTLASLGIEEEVQISQNIRSSPKGSVSFGIAEELNGDICKGHLFDNQEKSVECSLCDAEECQFNSSIVLDRPTTSRNRRSLSTESQRVKKDPKDTESTLWTFFYKQRMLEEVLNFSTRFAQRDVSSLALNAILGDLESEMGEDDISILLRQIDWESEICKSFVTTTCDDHWSKRAWRFLCSALANSVRRGEKQVRMFMRVKQSTGTFNESVWERHRETIEFEGNTFALELQTRSKHPQKLGPLELNVKFGKNIPRFGTPEVSATDQGRLLRRKVSSIRVDVIENGCNCEVRRAMNDLYGFRGFTARRNPQRGARDYNDTSLWSFTRSDGISFIIMDTEQLEAWMRSHRRQCGLVIQVRFIVDDHKLRDSSRAGRRNANDTGADAISLHARCPYGPWTIGSSTYGVGNANGASDVSP